MLCTKLGNNGHRTQSFPIVCHQYAEISQMGTCVATRHSYSQPSGGRAGDMVGGAPEQPQEQGLRAALWSPWVTTLLSNTQHSWLSVAVPSEVRELYSPETYFSSQLQSTLCYPLWISTCPWSCWRIRMFGALKVGGWKWGRCRGWIGLLVGLAPGPGSASV